MSQLALGIGVMGGGVRVRVSTQHKHIEECGEKKKRRTEREAEKNTGGERGPRETAGESPGHGERSEPCCVVLCCVITQSICA